MYNFLQIIFHIFFKLIYRTEVIGRENIPETNKLIIIANHKSNFDPIFISAFFNRQIYWMAKEELFKNKLFGNFISALGAFPINRFGVDIKAIKTSLSHIKNGEVLGIFPEGTRVNEKNYSIVKAGTSIIAHKSKALVLPVYIDGNYKLFYKMRLIYKKPIDLSNYSKLTNEEYEIISRNMMRRIYGDEEVESLPG